MNTYYDRRYTNASRLNADLNDDQRSEKLIDLSTQCHELYTELNALLKGITARLVEEWKTAGGCDNCLGWGRVVTWATLDGRGYTETGSCPSCGGAAPGGQQPGSQPDGWFVVATPGDISVNYLANSSAGTKMERALAFTYEMQIESLLRDIDDETEHCIVEKGKTVTVFKGRKVPQGTTGECFWIGTGGYGRDLRVGIRDANEEVHWTALSNVKVAA